MSKKKQNPDIPLLKAYLRSAEPYPHYVPTWIGPAGWWGFGIVSVVLAIGFELACLGPAIAGALMFAFTTLMRSRFKPQSQEDKADELVYASLRKLKGVAGDSNLQKRLPSQVLIALENAVEAHNCAVARLSTLDPLTTVEASSSLRKSLNACFLAAVSVLRHDEMSASDWKAIQDKSSLINEIVGAIQDQTARMREPEWVGSERLAALRELDQADPTQLRIR